MKAQDEINFTRIAEAINFIQLNFKRQPNLEEIAEKANLSPFHFQRLFTEWAGTSPKRFLQYISIGYAKTCLKENQSSLFETALDTGLSGTSRLHDLFVNIEGMTPGEYKNGGENLAINYSFAATPFGTVIVASTQKGICQLVFSEDDEVALMQLKNKFPAASYTPKTDLIQQNALAIFQHDWTKLKQVKLHLKGTDFQLKIWETLLKIPMGGLSTYGRIANEVGKPKASRAAGTAIGDNPVAFLIPCHRVIQASGALGGYRWDLNRKTAIIGWEAAKMETRLLIE
ncbi:methylated-DNA--[protein]-cysteine S-methyltransferase [Pedobacter petrophilus]|uniref:methylated-DNA--[protein]-cysteine S-methyltransferase n=1 Tax=Pedobacter petrophilus TaxID=1908241 RepID=A0A7K0FVU1_9SPHI|nr:methylated-DNA--[protein]-cysteine S-methyltransferase [Pedobacter petrophilus]MRX75541.1 methylated-DNA--[protein]-cysteine S-methyltransferase [Pedobacter petrophilus]